MKAYTMAQQKYWIRTFLASFLTIMLLVDGWGQPENVSALGNTYYVAPPPAGNDSNPGTEAQPWGTIQHAADMLWAGDTVYIKTGTYPEQVIPQRSGSAGNYITYAAYPGHTVTIDGSGVPVPADGGLFDVSGRNYIKISGLRAIDSAGAGIYADGSSYIIIEKNYTYNTVSSGIGVWNSNNIVIDGNEVVLACNDGEQEDITVANTNTFEVKNNHVHHGGPGTNGGEGIDAKDGSCNGKIYKNHVHHLNNRPGIYVDAWDKPTYNIEVFQNTVHDIAGNDGFVVGSEEGGLLENIRIYNNIAYNNGVTGLTISRAGGASSHPVKDIRVINNTFYNNGSAPWGGGIAIDNPNVANVVIRNNICSQNLSFQIERESDVPAGQLTVDHNLVYGYLGYGDEFDGSDCVAGDPRFVNPAIADFHLQANSPAIDKGSAVDAPPHDFDGNPRPQGGIYDIGAYEVAGLAATPPPVPTATPSAVVTAPTATPQIAAFLPKPTSEPQARGGIRDRGICPGTAALPLALAGLVGIRCRRR